MRQELERILGEEFRYLALETRERLGMIQKEMGKNFKWAKVPIPN